MTVRPRCRVAGRAADAATALRLFRTRKELLLRESAEERRTPRDVLVALERYYQTLTRDYLRGAGASYEAWLSRGPRPEIEEVRAAVLDPAVWDRLVETYARRETP